MATETWLNEGKERLTAEKLTEMVGDKDIKVVGFYDHKKATGINGVVWSLVTMDDGQVLGEKPSVSVFATEKAAKNAMFRDMAEMAAERGFAMDDVEYSDGGYYAQTKNGRYSWCVEQTEVRRV